MRHLLLLSLIVFGFGQTNIITKEYSIPISEDTNSINIMDIIGEESGIFKVQPIYAITDYPLNDDWFNVDLTMSGGSYTGLYCNYNNDTHSSYPECELITDLNMDYHIVHEDKPALDAYLSTSGDLYSVNLIVRVSGVFTQDQSYINGDLNYDSNIDIYDIILMVNLVLDGFNSVNVLEIMNLKS